MTLKGRIGKGQILLEESLPNQAEGQEVLIHIPALTLAGIREEYAEHLRKPLWRALILEDSYEHLVTIYVPCLAKYKKLFEFHWLTEVSDIAQGTIDFMRALIGQQRENLTEPLQKLYDDISRLLQSPFHILVADKGLREAIDPMFPYRLEYDDPWKLYQALLKVMSTERWDLLIVDRQIPRINGAEHPNKRHYHDRTQWKCNGVDLMVEYLKQNQGCQYIVISVEADNAHGVDNAIWPEAIEGDRLRYCDKRAQGFEEAVEQAMDKVITILRGDESFISSEACRLFKRFASGEIKDRTLKDLCPAFDCPVGKDIFRRVILALYFHTCVQENKTSLGTTELADVAGYNFVSPTVLSTHLSRADLRLTDDIQQYRFRREEAQWVAALLISRQVPVCHPIIQRLLAV